MQENEPLYVISVAARLLQLHPQTLRKYERVGFVIPSRTQGNLRLYSGDDIRRLRQVKRLVDDQGVNLAGVNMALDITERIRLMQRKLRDGRLNDTRAVSQALDEILDILDADPSDE